MSTLLTVLVVALACVAISFYRLRKLSRTPRDLNFVPDPNNRKEVFIQGWNSEEFSKILVGFQQLYANCLGNQIGAKVASLKDGTLHITFPQDFPNQLFPYLINYSQYPKGLEPKAGAVSIIGRAPISEQFEGIPDPKLIGLDAVIYVPSDDRSYDVVYVQVGEETFANSFASSSWKKVVDPRIPAGCANLISTRI